MNVKAFFQKNLIHIGVFAFMLILVAIYFKPQLDGYSVKQHDIEQYLGSSRELDTYRLENGKDALWTNSMFGGMPAEQISVVYPGNWFKKITNGFMDIFPYPLGSVLLHLLCFYIFARLLKINPVVALIGAVAFSFASYELQIIQAGHTNKSMTMAFLPAVLGSFIYAYRTNMIRGIILTALFMSFDLAMNHLQVTYYFGIVLAFIGIFFFIEAIQKNEFKKFILTTSGIIAALLLAIAINSGNILLTSDYAKSTIRGGNEVTINPDGTPAKNQSEGLDRDYITHWSYGIGETFSLVSPYVKGPGSMALADSPFREKIESSDLSTDEINGVLNNSAYWGEQPGTSGPVYIGVISVLLAFLGLFFVKDRLKWALFAATVLAVMLSWGKNFMGLTDFFIDHVPGYNKFRAVTIILMMVELTVPVMGVIFLNQLIKERESIREQRIKFFSVVGGFFLILLIVKLAGLSDGYSSSAERAQMAGLTTQMEGQIRGLDPVQAKTQYGIDVTNPEQVRLFAEQNSKQYFDNYENVKEVRKDIFHSSMNRSLLFVFFAAALLALFIFTKSAGMVHVLTFGLLFLTLIDILPVSYNYLGTQEIESNFKYWQEAGVGKYPVSANEADEMILQSEVKLRPSLEAGINKAQQEGMHKAEELDYSGQARTNLINAYRFSALNSATNYRVFDLDGGFSSTRASYFHKSLGGYHGAKLRNIDNMIKFHIGNMNSHVLDMLNVKYLIRTEQNGIPAATPNPSALGNAWLVKRVEKYATPNEEIRALGNQFKLSNAGAGTLLVNGTPQPSASVYGGESIKYLLPGKDTMDVSLQNGLEQGIEALLVMDRTGKAVFVMPQVMQNDTAKLSFTPMVSMTVTNEFIPEEEAVILKSEDKKTAIADSYSGEGTIRLTSYAPNKLVYSADVKGDQLAVFSEIYYENGWKAFVDDKEMPILKVNYLLRGLELKNGKHKVVFVYDLPKYYTANMIARTASIVLLLLFGGLIVQAIRERKKRISQTDNELK